MARPLETAEEETARLVERAGLSRTAARCFVALLRGQALGAVDLADIAGMARQDVTTASRELVAAGLVMVEPRNDGSRGRPSNRYSLAKDRGGAVVQFIGGRRTALQAELALLKELEARLL